jgi:hypothetical protein
MIQDINLIKKNCESYFLKNFNLNVPEDWLKQCIEYLVEDHPVNVLVLDI